MPWHLLAHLIRLGLAGLNLHLLALVPGFVLALLLLFALFPWLTPALHVNVVTLHGDAIHFVDRLVLLSVGVMDGVDDLLDLGIHALCLRVLSLRLLHLPHFVVGECGYGGLCWPGSVCLLAVCPNLAGRCGAGPPPPSQPYGLGGGEGVGRCLGSYVVAKVMLAGESYQALPEPAILRV